MNFNNKSTFCFIAFVLVLNVAMITGRPAEDDVSPTSAALTTDKEGKTTVEELFDTSSKHSSSADTSSSSVSNPGTSSSSVSNPGTSSSSVSSHGTSKTTELAQGDQPDGREPNSASRPEVDQSAKPTKDTTTVPPLLHSSHSSEGSLTESSSTSTTTTTTTTTAAPGSATMPTGGNGNVQQTSTETTPSTTTKGHNAATGLHAVQFACFVASAILVLVR